ncbi:hypothetical protein GCM10009564_12550 [Streptomyces thermogriseus]|uniref:Uncharacterized protein n=1 Tax=Streptomyces thermogriseus TaxID=75292 RepID=A0ABN1SUX4_9ACTN
MCRGRCAASPVADHRAGRGRRLRITRFHPSLHLDPADGHRRLGSFDPAGEHAPRLPADAHGAFPRAALDEAAEAVFRRDTTQRLPTPGPAA